MQKLQIREKSTGKKTNTIEQLSSEVSFLRELLTRNHTKDIAT